MSPNSNSSLPFSLFEDQAMLSKQIKDVVPENVKDIVLADLD